MFSRREFLKILVGLMAILIFTSGNASVDSRLLKLSISKSDINEESAKKWFNFYYSSGREDFNSAYERGLKYRKSMELVLAKFGIPLDFYYLAMTESYFNHTAQSSKKAAGIWQFIPSTAKAYGLKINNGIDERIHPIKSTIAAAKYLKDLHNIFNDWALAAAAYNAGEYRVLRAIKKGQTRSFKELAKRNLLPKETIEYVSKIWVTREIDLKIRKPSNSLKDIYLSTSPLRVPVKDFDLKTISVISEVKLNEIKKLNPDIYNENISKQLEGEVTIYLPQLNATVFNSFIRNNGLISKVKKPKFLESFGLIDNKVGDQIKVTIVGEGKLKIKNIRTKKAVIVPASKFMSL